MLLSERRGREGGRHEEEGTEQFPVAETLSALAAV